MFVHNDRAAVLSVLARIYGEQQAPHVLAKLDDLVASRAATLPAGTRRGLTEADALLITYPDQVRSPGELPLRTLSRFAGEYLSGIINTLHLLPFFPSSSDDGFSVTDYLAVDPTYGDWGDIERLSRGQVLMLDAVINHASVRSQWFQSFISNDQDFADFFIEVRGKPDLRSVVRPRTTPLITEFDAPLGKRSIWTTFSADQADLNYRNPEVLLRIVDVLLTYVARGADLIRLDAVGYLWKEIGTACIHLPQTHAIVQLIRLVMDSVAPHVKLLTETNVMQRENLEYLQGDLPEAHLAYNFALPPLVLHAFMTSRATTLADWASALPELPEGASLLNVLATHDGIGLNGGRGFLSEAEIEQLSMRIEASGGHVSRRANARGDSDAYELNMNYMDALDAVANDVDSQRSEARFIAAHGIMLALRGVPAIYFHSLVGSRGWREGARMTGRPRSINRQKLPLSQLRSELGDTGTPRYRIYRALGKLLRTRQAYPAFSPFMPQRVLCSSHGVFGVLRGKEGDVGQVLCLHNVTSERQAFAWSAWQAGCEAGTAVDLIENRKLTVQQGAALDLAPYQSLWLGLDAGASVGPA